MSQRSFTDTICWMSSLRLISVVITTARVAAAAATTTIAAATATVTATAAAQFSSGQPRTLVSIFRGKPICVLPCLSNVFPPLPLKLFQCSSY